MSEQAEVSEEPGVEASKKHFTPDHRLEGAELEAVVEDGLKAIRGLLDRDKDVAWARKSDPPDVAMPNKHNYVVKGGVDGVTYSFSDTSEIDDQTDEVVGERVHILRNDKLDNQAEVTLIKRTDGQPSLVDSKIVFLGDEHKQPIYQDFRSESRRTKLSAIAELFGIRRQQPSTEEPGYRVDRDYIPQNTGLAANNMFEMIDFMRADFALKDELPAELGVSEALVSSEAIIST